MNILERLFPGWAASRAQARAEASAYGVIGQRLGALGGGGYTGASSQRKSMKNWSTTRADADTALLPDLPTLRERSHDLFRNTPGGRGIVGGIATDVIGIGLSLRSAIDKKHLGLSDEAVGEWQEQAEREFAFWAVSPECDYERQKNFAVLQQLAFTAQLCSGDVFVLMPWVNRRGVPYDLQVQLIDAARVCNPDDRPDGFSWEEQKDIAGGIERDLRGVPVAIHIRSIHPGDNAKLAERPTWKRVPIHGASGRRNVLHLMQHSFIDQSRGEPLLAPIIETLKQLSTYAEAELSAAVVNAILAVFVKRPLEDGAGGGGYSGEGEETKPWEREDNYSLGPGSWVDGAPGEELQIVSAVRPSNQYDAFFLAVMRQIGMAVGVPYEVLIKHFSSSYSASRAALLEAAKVVKVRQANFAESFCQPIYTELLTEAVMKGRLVAPGFLQDATIRKSYSDAYWIGATMGQIDPVKEVEAANKRVVYGFSTRGRETAELTGMDHEDVIGAQAQEKKAAAAVGLDFSEAQKTQSDTDKPDTEKEKADDDD